MILLAIDTSTDRSVIALADRTGGVIQATHVAGRQHGRELVPHLKALLATAGIAPGDVEAIAVGLGPGSYTGSRVGVTAAKTLAYATGATLIGINSLHAIGRNAPAEAGRVAVVADAQRGEVYTVELTRPTSGRPLTPATETRIESLSTWIEGLAPGWMVLGPALELPRVRSVVPTGCLPPSGDLNHPRAEPLLELAREAMAAGRSDNPWLLEPLYLRRSAAEDQWDSRKSMSPG